MNKWYQTIIVNHKEKDGKTTHLLDDENYKKLCQERAEQLKEIDRLKSIIKEVREYIENNSYKTEWGDLEQDNEDININEDLTEKEFIEGLIEILDKGDKDGEK